MPKKPNERHELTPVASSAPALFAAIPIGFAVALSAALLLFGIFSPPYWDHGSDIAGVGDLAWLANMLERASSMAAPSPLIFHEDQSPVERFFLLLSQGAAWIAYTWKCPSNFWHRMSETDMCVQLSLRALGALCAGSAAAIPAYRHVAFRTPRIRTARYVEGPQVFWFDAAVTKAREHLAQSIRRYSSGISLAPGIALPRKAEHESFFAFGLPGSGKSVIIEGVARQALDRGDRVLYVDVKGGARGKIANLIGRRKCAALGLGRRCSVWAIGKDTRTRAALGQTVTTLIPESREPVWSAASRLVFKGLISCLISEHGSNWGWMELRTEISRPVEEIAQRLRGVMPQVAEMLRGKGGDPTTMSLSVIFNAVAHVSEIVDACAVFEAEGRRRLSLTNWAQGLSQIRAVVLEHDLSDPENSALLLSAQMRIIAGELLGSGVPDRRDHRVFVVADELPRLTATAAGDVAQLSALGRSRGIRVVASAQSVAQLERLLTSPGAEALVENFGTVIVCKTRPGRNAENIAANLIGKTTYETEGGGENATLHERPAFSPLQMATCLGLTYDWRGQAYIRAAIVGWGDVYVVEWTLNRWERL